MRHVRTLPGNRLPEHNGSDLCRLPALHAAQVTGGRGAAIRRLPAELESWGEENNVGKVSCIEK